MYSRSLSCMSVLGLAWRWRQQASPAPPAPWQAGCLLPSSWERSPGLTLRCLPSLKPIPLSVPTSPRCLRAVSQSSQPCPPLSSLDLCGVPTHGVAFGASGLGLPEGAPIGQLSSHRPSSLPGHAVNSAAASKANPGPDSYVLAFKNTRF